MPDLQQSDKKDAEESRGIGGHKAGFDNAESEHDQRSGRAEETGVKAAIEEIIFVIEELELNGAGHWLLADFGNFREAYGVNDRLEDQERGDGEDGMLIEHRCRFLRTGCRRRGRRSR